MRRVHMVGICGVGMAGLARLLKARGWDVSGCDELLNPLADWLRSCGIEVLAPHDEAHISSVLDLVVRTAAVREDAAEIVAARREGIAVRRRGEVLAELVSGTPGAVAVAGTHGKTTTSTFITRILRAAGRDPSWCIGGMTDDMPVAGAGESGPLVVEADESDGTLALYHPDIAVITNIEFDHMEHFGSVADFMGCFGRFAGQARKRVWFCGDDAGAREVCEGLEGARSYGFGGGVFLRGEVVADGGVLRVFRQECLLGELGLAVPGRHNALNLLGAVGACLELGLDFAEIAAKVAGIVLPQRRFEKVGDWNGARVISDYAHHPSEVRALVAMAREAVGESGRLLAVFQPHRYSRTLALGHDFPAAFAGVDELVLVPVYAASERPLAGGRICDLYGHFAARDEWRGRVKLAESLAQAREYLCRRLCPGDTLLVTGAGDVERIAKWFGEQAGQVVCEAECGLAGGERRNLGRLTLYGVGGDAECYVEVESVADLRDVLRRCAADGVDWRILGAGSNVLVSDLGVSGVVMRLKGRDFQAIRQEDDCLIVGGAVPADRLLAKAAEQGLGGLEFLAGVPGMVGGLARMNAGANGAEFGELVLWIRGLKSDGTECTLSESDLNWEYRGCPALRDVVVTEVALKMVKRHPGDIFADMEAIRAERGWQKGLRCAGSVFRNPPGDMSAGELIEKAGLKGRELGGARIFEGHANFIVAEKGACASDVVALMRLAQAAVLDKFGIELRREVEVWGDGGR